MLATRTLCAVGLAAQVSVTVIRRTEFDFRVLELYVRDPVVFYFQKFLVEITHYGVNK